MARIVDLTGLAGVYATRLLVEAGHTVIRVEAPGGDSVRRLGPLLGDRGIPDVERGAYHAFHNAGKKSVALDLARPAARDVLARLLERVDAVVANGVLPLDEARLDHENPRLVRVRIDDEPELIAYARSGLLSITGHAGQEPVVLGAHIALAATGMYAGLAVAAGLYGAQATGRGSSTVISVQACLESWMEQPMVTFLTTGAVTERRGFRGAITAVSGAFATRDGYWMVSVPHGPDGWSRFASWIKDPVLSADPGLADERERLKQRDRVLDRIAEWSSTRSRDAIVSEAQRQHVPASPVATPADLVEDPQLVARGFQRPVAHPLFGHVMFPQGAIATVNGTVVGPAPMLGQHNAEILAELGYGADEQSSLGTAEVRR